MQELFVRSGGTLLEHHKVEQIQPGSPVKVVTSKGVLNALQVVITAGMCVCVIVYMSVGGDCSEGTCVACVVVNTHQWITSEASR